MLRCSLVVSMKAYEAVLIGCVYEAYAVMLIRCVYEAYAVVVIGCIYKRLCCGAHWLCL